MTDLTNQQIETVRNIFDCLGRHNAAAQVESDPPFANIVEICDELLRLRKVLADYDRPHTDFIKYEAYVLAQETHAAEARRCRELEERK